MQSISVLIPLYNKENYVEQTLRSIDRQMSRSRFAIEVVIVDDVSTDNSLNLVRNFKWLNLKNVVISQNEVNSGPANALNKAFMLSKGDFIVPMDADDYLLRLSLLTRFDYLEKNLDVDWVSGNELFMDMDGSFLPGKEYVHKLAMAHDPFSKEEILELYFDDKLIFGPHTIMMRRAVLEKIRWNDTARTIQDTIFIMDLLISDFKAGFIEDYVAVYRYDLNRNVDNSLYTRSLKSGLLIKDMEIALGYFSSRLSQENIIKMKDKLVKKKLLREELLRGE